MKRHILSVLAALAGILGVSILMIAATVGAQGTEGGDTPGCTPQTAYAEETGWVLVSPGDGWYQIGQRTVTDQEAYDEEVFDHWQRYSWTGGPHDSDDPPAFPSDDWQSNVQGDPHDVGQPGAYFRSHGNSGKGDWFYLEAVTKVINHPAVTHEEYRFAFDHPAVECPTETVTVTDPTETVSEPTETVTLPTETVTVTPPTETVTLPTETTTVTETPEPTDGPSCIGRPVVGGPCGGETTDSTDTPVPDEPSTPMARDTLPNTGGPMPWLIGLGSLLVIAGALLVGFQTQRKAS